MPRTPTACATPQSLGLQRSSAVEKAGGSLLELDEAERAVVENDDLHGQSELDEADEVRPSAS